MTSIRQTHGSGREGTGEAVAEVLYDLLEMRISSLWQKSLSQARCVAGFKPDVFVPIYAHIEYKVEE
jgi:hypothetical protein